MPTLFLKKLVLTSVLLCSWSANAASFYFRQPATGLQPALAAPSAAQLTPSLLLSTPTLSFATAVGLSSEAQSVSLKNQGTGPLILGTLSSQGTDAADFRIVTDTCSGATLAVGDINGCAVSLQFSPTAVGAKQASLSVPSNVPGGGQAVVLSGTASPAVDPQAGQVSLLMHMEGADGSTTFTDSALGHSITRTGSPTITTSMAGVGAASANISYGAFLQIAAQGAEFQFPGDFTIESWVKLNNPARSTPQALFGVRGSQYFDVRWYNYRFQMTANAGSGSDMGGTITANTWTHLAWVRYNGVITLYVNGVATGTKLNNANTLGYANTAAQIGSSTAGGENLFDGAIDEFRITKMARYTSNFTPARLQFPNP